MSALARHSTLTMSAVMSQRPASELGEMAVWDPSEDLSDPASAFQRADRGVMRMLGSVGLAGLLLVAIVAVQLLLAP